MHYATNLSIVPLFILREARPFAERPEVTGIDGVFGASSSSQVSSQLFSHPSFVSNSDFPPLETGSSMSSFWYLEPLPDKCLRLKLMHIQADTSIRIVPKKTSAVAGLLVRKLMNEGLEVPSNAFWELCAIRFLTSMMQLPLPAVKMIKLSVPPSMTESFTCTI